MLVTASGAIRTLVRDRDDVDTPRWSPDGGRLAFLASPPKDPDAKDEPSPQLFVLRMDGGDPVRITDTKHGVAAYAWRPDGARLRVPHARRRARREAHQSARRLVRDHRQRVDRRARRRSRVHLWTIGADGKHPHRVTHGSWSLDGEPSFAPDGRSVFVTRRPTASGNHYRARDVVRIALANGAVRTIARARRSCARHGRREAGAVRRRRSGRALADGALRERSRRPSSARSQRPARPRRAVRARSPRHGDRRRARSARTTGSSRSPPTERRTRLPLGAVEPPARRRRRATGRWRSSGRRRFARPSCT